MDQKLMQVARVALSLLLLFAVLLLAVACAPKGTYTSPLGDSYRFYSGDRYSHTSSEGKTSEGSYQIDGETIRLTDADGKTVTLPYSKEGRTVVIAGIAYEKD